MNAIDFLPRHGGPAGSIPLFRMMTLVGPSLNTVSVPEVLVGISGGRIVARAAGNGHAVGTGPARGRHPASTQPARGRNAAAGNRRVGNGMGR